MLQLLFKHPTFQKCFFVTLGVLVVCLAIATCVYFCFEHRSKVLIKESRQQTLMKFVFDLQDLETRTKNGECVDSDTLFWWNNLTVPMYRRAISHLTAHVDSINMPPILFYVLLHPSRCDHGQCSMLVVLGDEQFSVIGIKLSFSDGETMTLRDTGWVDMYLPFDFEKSMTFYLFKNEAWDCLNSILPEFMRERIGTNVIKLSDAAFDSLIAGRVTASLVLSDGTSLEPEKIWVAPSLSHCNRCVSSKDIHIPENVGAEVQLDQK